MGVYTRCNFSCEIDKATPQQFSVLNAMVEGQEDEILLSPEMKEIPLFNTTRWRWMLKSDSWCFEHVAISQLCKKADKSWFLSVDFDIKNYDNEIELFIEWIKTLSSTKGFVGYTMCEEDDEPTLIYF